MDLRKALVDEFMDFYRERFNPNASTTEARIYANAYAEVYLSFDYEGRTSLSYQDINDMLLNVFLRLLRLHGDKEVYQFMQKN